MHIYRQPYDNELYHHGIMGMKWGVRRYQNPDGSYTEAGRNRYGKKLAEEFDKWDIKNGANTYFPEKDRTSLQIASDLANYNSQVRKFNRKSSEYKELQRAGAKYRSDVSKLNLQINAELQKKYGKNGQQDHFAEYITDGIKLMQERSKALESGPRYMEASKNYERVSRKFVDDLLGEYGAKESSSGLPKVSNVDGVMKVGAQTISDRISLELLRGAGGAL